MGIKELFRRLTGVSTPIGGVSFKPAGEPERTIAFRVLSFLEDRRILNWYHAVAVEDPNHSVKSVFEIRNYLTEQLQRTEAYPQLAGCLWRMRAACRKFLDEVGVQEGEDLLARRDLKDREERWEYLLQVFHPALIALREEMAVCITELAERNNVDLFGELKNIPVKR